MKIGELVLEFEVDTTEFERGLEKAIASLSEFESAIAALPILWRVGSGEWHTFYLPTNYLLIDCELVSDELNEKLTTLERKLEIESL